MSDTPLLKELLRQILEGISRIERRFEPIDSADDFSKDNDGVDRLDGIAMMLIGIGECLKRFEKSGGKSLIVLIRKIGFMPFRVQFYETALTFKAAT